MILDSSSY